jgi:hypothetical protein
VDAALRERRRAEWNVPVVWPVIALIFFLGAGTLPAWLSYRRRERSAGRAVVPAGRAG